MCKCPSNEVTLGGFIFRQIDHIESCPITEDMALSGYMETRE